jgi:hypothetical protein
METVLLGARTCQRHGQQDTGIDDDPKLRWKYTYQIKSHQMESNIYGHSNALKWCCRFLCLAFVMTEIKFRGQ